MRSDPASECTDQSVPKNEWASRGSDHGSDRVPLMTPACPGELGIEGIHFPIRVNYGLFTGLTVLLRAVLHP